MGGTALREDEPTNFVMKMVPSVIREQLVFKMQNLRIWNKIKDWIREKARNLVVCGSKGIPAHSLELADVLSDDFREKTEG